MRLGVYAAGQHNRQPHAKHGGGRGGKRPVFTKDEQRAIVIEALGILPNVWQVYRCLSK
jgi:hypothetical protein